MSKHFLISWKERNALLDHAEKCLLHLLRNPPDSTPSRLWERDIKVAAVKLGYEFVDIVPSTGCRDSIGREVARNKSDQSPVFLAGEPFISIS